MTGLLLLALLQGQGPSVTATVDQSRLAVGDEVTLTITATSPSADPMRIILPSLDGFEVVARTERAAVALSDSTGRTSTLELQLSALRAGTFRLGPFEVEQGGVRSRTGFVTIVVDAGTGGSQTISPRLQALLRRAPPPSRPGAPALTLVVSDDHIYVGDQVDVVTAAWFPRDLRARLRRPPTLTPPTVSGVWSYPQPTPPGIAASRKVGDTWYDLFVSHQIVFPLVAGTVEIAKASLQYSVPVAMQFFSQEERYNLESNGATLTVLPLPDAGKPASFTGAVGRGLTLVRRGPASGRAGEAVPLEVELSGKGNVALWPAPVITWPDSLRRYQDRTDDRITNDAGLLGGTKNFRFLALPDSAGPLHLPALNYAYFDLDAGTYRTLTAPAMTLNIAPAPENAASRPTPPALLRGHSAPLATQIWGGVPLAGWLGLALLPVLFWGGLEAGDWHRRRFRRRATDLRPNLPRSDRRLLAALRALVPDADVRTGPALSSALRAAGVSTELAQRIARVRDDFLRARYSDGAGARGERDLAREMDELTRTLGGESRHRERRGRRLAMVVIPVALLLSHPAQGQSPEAESLYESGAYRAAAEAFTARTRTAPDVAANWYGLGAAEYRLGSDARARAAWLRAGRLAPRSVSVRRALELVPGPDSWSRQVSWISPLTPDELALVALALWLAGWVLVLTHRRRFRLRSVILLSAAALAGAAALVVAQRYGRPLAIVTSEVPLRLSPHGRAPEVLTPTPGASVLPGTARAGWWLVDAGGRVGWLPDEAMVRVDR
ncbi:MAG TPA: BatD family protein [Gemmatimonadales bacterium]|nr:BatD family protein [Gemmatimonadales bacterium]